MSTTPLLTVDKLATMSSSHVYVPMGEYFSTKDNNFYPLYIIHTSRVRTKDEIIYDIPWTMSSDRSTTWQSTLRYLLKSTFVVGATNTGKAFNEIIYVVKGFVFRLDLQCRIVPLFVVATNDLDYLMSLNSSSVIEPKKFFLLQQKSFIKSSTDKNIRAQLRKLYINPLIEQGVDTMDVHSVSARCFNPVKMNMSFKTLAGTTKVLTNLVGAIRGNIYTSVRFANFEHGLNRTIEFDDTDVKVAEEVNIANLKRLIEELRTKSFIDSSPFNPTNKDGYPTDEQPIDFKMTDSFAELKTRKWHTAADQMKHEEAMRHDMFQRNMGAKYRAGVDPAVMNFGVNSALMGSGGSLSGSATGSPDVFSFENNLIDPPETVRGVRYSPGMRTERPSLINDDEDDLPF